MLTTFGVNLAKCTSYTAAVSQSFSSKRPLQIRDGRYATVVMSYDTF